MTSDEEIYKCECLSDIGNHIGYHTKQCILDNMKLARADVLAKLTVSPCEDCCSGRGCSTLTGNIFFTCVCWCHRHICNEKEKEKEIQKLETAYSVGQLLNEVLLNQNKKLRDALEEIINSNIEGELGCDGCAFDFKTAKKALSEYEVKK